jgi:PAS domain S-box-containing protein
MLHFNAVRGPAVLKTMRSILPRYAITLLLVGIAFIVRGWLQPVMGQQSFAIFLGTVLVAAWIGGVGPALTALVLLHIAHAYWFQTPTGLWQPTMASVVTTSAYYLVGIMVGFLSQTRAAALQRARDQRHEAISQREQLHTTLSCMADGVLVADVDGRLTLMNPAAESMTGWNLAEAHGKPWWEVFSIRHEEGQDCVASPIDRVVQGRRVVHEHMPLQLTSRTGRTFPIAYSAAPVEDLDGHITGVVLIFRDESERRRTEVALRNADRRKDEFLATLAHELRNPLAPISMGLELLKLSRDDPEAAEEIRSMMQRQTLHMVRLIDDLLDVSRITRGKLELRKSAVELADVVRNAVEATRPLLEESEHTLAVHLPDKPLLLYADANRLTQVFTNLLNNAAKYTPREGRIELTAEQMSAEVSVTISDSGIGIPADKMDCVFDMFAQINESSEFGHTGLGIGLTLVKRLVEMHGGRVEVESRGRNLGTTFRVRLPAFPEPLAMANGRPQGSQIVCSKIKRRVLVVDDNTDALESLSRFVTLMGNEVQRARDGLEALEVARSFNPDIVLMDLGMPNLNGYEAARRIRQEPWGREMALVATSGWGQDEDRRRTAEAGFDRHLVKPIALDALREALELPLSPHAAEPNVEPQFTNATAVHDAESL